MVQYYDEHDQMRKIKLENSFWQRFSDFISKIAKSKIVYKQNVSHTKSTHFLYQRKLHLCLIIHITLTRTVVPIYVTWTVRRLKIREFKYLYIYVCKCYCGCFISTQFNNVHRTNTEGHPAYQAFPRVIKMHTSAFFTGVLINLEL